jgi:hypothetical protein
LLPLPHHPLLPHHAGLLTVHPTLLHAGLTVHPALLLAIHTLLLTVHALLLAIHPLLLTVGLLLLPLPLLLLLTLLLILRLLRSHIFYRNLIESNGALIRLWNSLLPRRTRCRQLRRSLRGCLPSGLRSVMVVSGISVRRIHARHQRNGASVLRRLATSVHLRSAGRKKKKIGGRGYPSRHMELILIGRIQK